MRAEKMSMINMVAKIEDVGNIIQDILKISAVQQTNVMTQIENNTFRVNVNEYNLQKVLDFNEVRPFEKQDTKRIQEIANTLKTEFEFNDLDDQLVIFYTEDELVNYYKGLKGNLDNIRSLDQKISDNEDTIKIMEEISPLDYPLEKIESLAYFKYRFGYLDKENRLKIKQNYENILATVFHLNSTPQGEIYLSIYPEEVQNEVDRILKSLNWKDIDVPSNLKGTPYDIIRQLHEENEKLKEQQFHAKDNLEAIKKQEFGKLKDYILSGYLLVKINQEKELMARSEHYFYFSGWIAQSDVGRFQKLMEKYQDMMLAFIDAEQLHGLTPPTKLKNGRLFRPFELLIKMYGTPNYRELDPTVFFGITYMLLFGAMFGDVGQGLFFVITGLLFAHYRNKMMGGVITRIGISSTIFGFLYGSVFGLEDIIPAIFMRPFQNIQQSLVFAIFGGIILLVIAYIFGIANRFFLNETKEALFSAEGIAGFLLFLTALVFVAQLVGGKVFIPSVVLILFMVLAMLAMVFQLPLTSILLKRRPLHFGTKISDYYVEEGFSLIETVISMFSGTISFIRVGAFAINHVGLFMAFTSIGKMIGSPTANIVMIIIGNIVILSLEALIVFIQSLRLEYYELFGKFYRGDGIEFKPSKLLD